jgi:hypothetical protein
MEVWWQSHAPCSNIVALPQLFSARRLPCALIRLCCCLRSFACSSADCCGSSAATESLFRSRSAATRPAQSVSGVGRHAGENVTVRFHGQTVTAQTDPIGYWEAWLKPEPAGGPYTLTVSGDSTATLRLSVRIFWSAMCGWLQDSRTWSFPLPALPAPSPHPEGRRKGDRRSQPSSDSPAGAEKSNIHRSPQRGLRTPGQNARRIPRGTSPRSLTSSAGRSRSAKMCQSGSSTPPGAARRPTPGSAPRRWRAPISPRSLKMRERSPRTRGGPTRSGPTTHAKMPLCRQKESRLPSHPRIPTITGERGRRERSSTP